MTLIIGFKCQDGLVLCADTQETITGYTKIDTDKISSMMCLGGCINVAGAGDGDMIDMAVDRLVDHFLLGKCPAVDWRAMQKEIETVMLTLYEYQARINPHFKAEDYPEFLIGFRAKDGHGLLKVSGTKVKRITRACGLGTGVLVGESLVKEMFDQNMRVKQAGLLAIYIMYRAKRYVDGVGGNTDILFIGDWGLTRIPTADVQKLETWWLEVERAGLRCAHWLTSGDGSDAKQLSGTLSKLKEGISFYDAVYADVDAVLNPTRKPEQGMVTNILRVGGKKFVQTESA